MNSGSSTVPQRNLLMVLTTTGLSPAGPKHDDGNVCQDGKRPMRDRKSHDVCRVALPTGFPGEALGLFPQVIRAGHLRVTLC